MPDIDLPPDLPRPALREQEMPRRDLLLAPLLAALLPGAASASQLDRTETIVTLPADIPWKERPDYPKNSVISAPLFGSRLGSGI